MAMRRLSECMAPLSGQPGKWGTPENRVSQNRRRDIVDENGWLHSFPSSLTQALNELLHLSLAVEVQPLVSVGAMARVAIAGRG